MNVLHLNKNDLTGGAAKAAYRLHSALKTNEINSKMLVQNKISYDPTVKNNLYRNKYLKYLQYFREFLDKYPTTAYNTDVFFSTGFFGNKINELNILKRADVINLHWIVRGFLSIKEINKISNSGKKLVWTLHDMWPFTGGCHHSLECDKYKFFCNKCPRLNSSKYKDLSYKIFKSKERFYKDLDITIVTLCDWMTNCAKSSHLFSDKNIHKIPNGVDTNLYKPINKNIARNILNISNDKFYILFGAQHINDPLKGYKYLKNAMNLIYRNSELDNKKIVLILFGKTNNEIEKLPFKKIIFNCYLSDYILPIIYSASDVFVIPSLAENLPNTVLESLACGTPVIGFNIGGVPDMIQHKKNGYLAKYKNSSSLANGIEWTFRSLQNNDFIKKNARKTILEKFNLKKQTYEYIKMYKKILE